MAHMVRKPYVQIDLGIESNWKRDAACANHPPELFELVTSEDLVTSRPDLEGRAVEHAREVNKLNFEKAKKVCASCPVVDACLSSASPEDFEWTVRGGIAPTSPSPHVQPRICRCGTEKKRRPNGGWWCNPCTNEKNKRNRRKKGVMPVKPAKKYRRGIMCKAGFHDEWTKKGDGNYNCAPCGSLRKKAKSGTIAP